MADPKYATLPGIVQDQPDVYETSELPESEQAIKQEDEFESNDVENVALNVDAAYERFQGKSVEPTTTDFSDRVKKHRHMGYSVWSQSEYEMLERGTKKETPLQKFQRLQHEIKELDQEVKQIKEDVVSESSSEQLSPVQLSKQVEYLQSQLTGLQLEKIIGPQAEVDLNDPTHALQKRLLGHLESFKQSATSTSPKKGEKKQPVPPVGSADQVTYELYYKPEQATFSRNQKVANIEQRLDHLESLIGQNPEKMSALTTGLSDKSLMGAVNDLTAKSNLLEKSNLDQVEGRLQAVNMKLNQMSEKKAVVEEAKMAKVSELYELIKKWDDMATSLPHIVDRMTSLQDLHEQALQFSAALTHLDTVQQQLTNQLQTHSSLLKNLQANFKENMAVIKTNCESIDKRMKVLKK